MPLKKPLQKSHKQLYSSAPISNPGLLGAFKPARYANQGFPLYSLTIANWDLP